MYRHLGDRRGGAVQLVRLDFDDQPREHSPHKKLHAFTPIEAYVTLALAQLQAGLSERSHTRAATGWVGTGSTAMHILEARCQRNRIASQYPDSTHFDEEI